MSRHHPLLTSSRGGCWSYCRCGWKAPQPYTTVTGAHIAFGLHLLCPDPDPSPERQEAHR